MKGFRLFGCAGSQTAASLVFLASTAPAHAAGGNISIADPSDLVLFGLGALGVVIGRMASRRPPKD